MKLNREENKSEKRTKENKSTKTVTCPAAFWHEEEQKQLPSGHWGVITIVWRHCSAFTPLCSGTAAAQTGWHKWQHLALQACWHPVIQMCKHLLANEVNTRNNLLNMCLCCFLFMCEIVCLFDSFIRIFSCIFTGCWHWVTHLWQCEQSWGLKFSQTCMFSNDQQTCLWQARSVHSVSLFQLFNRLELSAPGCLFSFFSNFFLVSIISNLWSTIYNL